MALKCLQCRLRESDLISLHVPLTVEPRSLIGAALDITVQEPIPLSSPLPAFPNVILTPHNGAHSQDAQWQATVANSVEALVRGYWPPFPANPGIQLRAPLQPWDTLSSVFSKVAQ